MLVLGAQGRTMRAWLSPRTQATAQSRRPTLVERHALAERDERHALAERDERHALAERDEPSSSRVGINRRP